MGPGEAVLKFSMIAVCFREVGFQLAYPCPESFNLNAERPVDLSQDFER